MTSELRTYLSRLTTDDVSDLGTLERAAGLNFWGEDHYRRFLAEMPEYFGCKVTVLRDLGPRLLCGFLLARSVCEQLEVLKLGVLPEFQGRGIGTQLMEAAYAEGLRRGCQLCLLEVRKSNESAVRFYLRRRFRFVGSRRDYYTDPVEDAWVMERPL
jgi:ribosomal protein S18 acetylase RimI-like enzyme